MWTYLIAPVAALLWFYAYLWELEFRRYLAGPGDPDFVSPAEALRWAAEAEADEDQGAGGHCGPDRAGDYWRGVAVRSAQKLR